MIGIRVRAFLGKATDEDATGWDEAQRRALQAKSPLVNRILISPSAG